MAGPVTADVELGGEKHTFRLTLESLRLIREKTGIDLLLKPKLEIEDLGLDGLTTIIWALLHHEKPDRTVEEVAAFVDLGDVGHIVRAMEDLLRKGAPRPEPAGSPTQPSPAPEGPSTGMSSKRSAATTSGSPAESSGS